MADFSIGSVSKQVGDIQRAYTWQLLLSAPIGVQGFTQEDLLIRCRSVVIPGRSQDVITSNFMGMEQFFPGRMHFTNPFNIMFEEFADRKIAKFLYKWQQLVFNASVGGGTGTEKPSAVAQTCQLQLLKYDGTKVANADMGLIQINNAWPESVAEVPMVYADNNAVQYTLALRYDTWEYITV